MNKLLLGLIVLSLVGCATVGSKVDTNKLSLIKEGVTNKSEVFNLLGKPTNISLASDSKTIVIYHWAKASNRAVNFIPGVNMLAGGVDMQEESVQILLNKNDIVEKIISYNSNSQVKSGLLNL